MTPPNTRPSHPTARPPASARVYTYLAPDARAFLRDTFDRVGDRWSLLVVAYLYDGPRRFGQLRRETAGISQRMLTVTLRQLQRDGLVRRTVFPVIPPRVDYELTRLGRSFADAVIVLCDWVLDHRATIEKSRREFEGQSAAR